MYTALSSYLLGFDVAGGAVEPHLAAQRDLGRRGPTDDPALFTAEREFLAQFAAVSALCWLHPEIAGQLTTGTQWLSPERPDLPDDLREPLRAVLARYVAAGQRSGPGLDEAAFWMSRAFERAGELASAITVILRRWLRHSSEFSHSGVLAELIDGLSVTTRSHRPAVSDLARDVRFRIFDEPVYRRLTAHVYANANRQLDELEAHPDRADRDELIRQLVKCPQPMRGLALRRWRTAETPLRAVLLEVYLRRVLPAPDPAVRQGGSGRRAAGRDRGLRRGRQAVPPAGHVPAVPDAAWVHGSGRRVPRRASRTGGRDHRHRHLASRIGAGHRGARERGRRRARCLPVRTAPLRRAAATPGEHHGDHGRV